MTPKWEMMQATFPGGDIGRLLEEGWEPFASDLTGRMVELRGQQVPQSLVSLRRVASPVRVDLGALRKVQ